MRSRNPKLFVVLAVACATFIPWCMARVVTMSEKSLVPATFSTKTQRRLSPSHKLLFNGEYHDVKILTNPYGHYIARGVREYLRLAGISATLVEAIDEEDAFQNVLYFVLFALEYDFPTGLRYIVYQLEQKQQSKWFNNTYYKVLDGATFVFEYSVQNYLNMEPDLQKKMAYLPIPLRLDNKEYSDFEYDVLFYGSMCARRSRILDDLQNKHGVRMYVAGANFGKGLDELIQKTRIVLNLHYYDNALLETTRINEALKWGKIVVSEEPMSEDKYSRQLYKDAVVFTKNLDNYDDRDVGELAKILKFYSSSQNYRQYTRDHKKNLATLQRYCFGRFVKALLSLGTLSPTRFYKRLSQETIYYLSLDESWQTRRDMFLRQPHLPANVERIAAIKASPGWVGCGLSYKFAINSAKSSGLGQVTICEDDARFPPSFKKDYKIIRKYLSTLDKWDIFVGLIADFDKTTRILNAEKYKGLEFVTIDKFTSTVFNIYNASSFDHILSWDEHDTNVDTNTIDRYLQNKNLTIITTNPYFFKHMELGSTLWGNITEYPAMFTTSEKAFSTKIQEFKSTADPSTHSGAHTRRSSFSARMQAPRIKRRTRTGTSRGHL